MINWNELKVNTGTRLISREWMRTAAYRAHFAINVAITDS